MANKKNFFIEGNIGAGKSTFLRIMNNYLQIQTVFEPHEKWQKVQSGDNLLDKFYKDTARWAYTFQTYAFVSRALEQKMANDKDEQDVFLIERSVYSDRYCFAKNCYEMNLMSPLEWDLYREWFNWLVDHYTPMPVGFIYLKTAPEVCYNRMRVRSRGEENGVTLDYLTRLHEKHESWLITKNDVSENIKKSPVLVLNCDKDFEHDVEEQRCHAQKIVEFFEILPKSHH